MLRLITWNKMIFIFVLLLYAFQLINVIRKHSYIRKIRKIKKSVTIFSLNSPYIHFQDLYMKNIFTVT